MALQAEEYRLLYRVACAYYDAGLTQQEIARRFGLSRPKVSRLLAQAREEGVVTISLAPPPEDRTALERVLEVRYGLDEALVVPSPSVQGNEAIASSLAPAAADCWASSVR